VDSAYSNNNDLKSIEDVGATAYAALGKGEDGESITVDDQLTAGEDKHEYKCLAGKLISIVRRRHHGKTEIAASPDFCRDCPFQQECKLFKKQGKILDFGGIHPTTLVYFRDRLLANDKASFAFDKVVEHLVAAGLVKKGAKQRIDSTHIIGNVRELSRS